MNYEARKKNFVKNVRCRELMNRLFDFEALNELLAIASSI